ncbi:MAG TPA: FtsX-like permease family protein [Actinomycetota bacterium]
MSFVALAVGALLVVVSASAYPLFVSASQSELLAANLHGTTVSRYEAGLTYKSTNLPIDAEGPGGGPLAEERGRAFAQAASGSPEVDPTVTQMLGPTVDVTLPGGVVPESGPVNGAVFSGDGAVDHLRVLQGDPGAEGDGVWLPDLAADPAGVGPGDEVELRLNGRSVTVTVDGVYRGLYALPRVGYFQPFIDEFVPAYGCFNCPTPPQPIVMSAAKFREVAEALSSTSQPADASFAWQAPLVDDPLPTLQQAQDLVAFADRLERRMQRPATPLGELVPCCGPWYGGKELPWLVTGENTFRTSIDDILQVVEERSNAAQAPILVLSIAALAIAMAVVAAAASFAFAARRVEIGVLTARGWGPGAVAAKAALESLAPVVVGTVLGYVLATVLIRVAGPDGAVDPAATARAIRGAVVASGAALLLIAVVSAASYVARHEHRDRLARAVLWFPWELLAFGAAWILYQRLETGGGLVESEGVTRPSGAVFLFPLALALGIGILVARIAVVALLRRRPGERSRVSAWFMAERRLASSSRLAALFLVASVLALAVFASAQAMAASLRGTVDAKAGVFVGSDVQLRVGLDSEPDTSGYRYPVTKASRVRDAGAYTGTEQHYDILAIDPTTLEGAAFWRDAFSDVPLSTLLDRVDSGPAEPLPIVVSNGRGIAVSSIDLGQSTVPVRVVGTTTSFPGTSSAERPLIVVDRDRLEATFAALGQPNPLNIAQGSTELWVHGPPTEVLDSADQLGVFVLATLTADEVKDIPYIDAAIDTFAMLNLLGVTALLLVLVVAIVYVQARQRARVLGAALSVRMGMTARTLRRSLVAELGAILGLALVLGCLVGIVSVSVVVPTLDPLPTIPPPPLITDPWVALGVAGVVLLAASFVGGAVAARASRRASLGEVMRAAT